jgi:hypothetical protein
MAGKHSIGESTLQNGSWGRAPNGGLLVSRITGHVESGIGVCPGKPVNQACELFLTERHNLSLLTLTSSGRHSQSHFGQQAQCANLTFCRGSA